jgi:hypothetical protein
MKTYTLIGLYGDPAECDDVVVDHLEGENVKEIVRAFYENEDYGEARRNSCRLVAIIEGKHNDSLSELTNMADPVRYEDIAENLK